MKISIGLLALLSSCVSGGLVKIDPVQDNIKTIGFFTGSVADDGLYKSKFEKTAAEVCPLGYTVIQRSRTPWTMEGVVLDRHNFYWVVRCALK